ncbi:hypothetical protein [Arthrobacter sp.]|uniref:sunset domain-containing protein n=1 Tax=Arthrobacter sp. TaxID=1667 RepID=UPI0028118277|nr:hypothetical protein [Arthrobacter sp.]
MDWLIWVIVIILIVAVVWWLLNRNRGASVMASDRAGASEQRAESVAGQSPAAAPASVSPEPAAAAPAPAPAKETESSGSSAYAASSEPTATAASTAPMAAEQVPTDDPRRREADWAEAPAPDGGDVDDWDADVEPTTAHSVSAARMEKDKAEDADKAEWEAQWSEGSTAPGQAIPAPHENTGTHAPTLPGAESAAAESADAETAASAPAEATSGETAATEASAAQTTPAPAAFDPDEETLQRAESSAVTESSLSHTAEPISHLAVDQPYGEGSAAAAADGSGPEGYTVKGDAETMTYFEETNPAYEEVRAGVWFESVAHAEAAGFRPPRRTRL